MSNVPLRARYPGPIKLLCATGPPPWSRPRRLSMYPRIALCTGTISGALLVNELSVENSLTTTPRLNPKPSKLLNAILALNVTVPVPWSTVKKRPTRKIPF